MPSLMPRPPVEGLPITRGSVTLELLDPGPVVLVAPYPGRSDEVSAALAAQGLGFPAPGTTRRGAALIQWAGREQAFLFAAVEALPGAAVIDQTDAWATFRLSGEDAEEVLARLVPLDLRPAAFPEGACARTLLFHSALAIRRDSEGLVLMVFRSMAATALHELDTAMRSVAAQR